MFRPDRGTVFIVVFVGALLSLSPQRAAAVEQPLEGDWTRFSLTGQAYGIAEWGASSVLESENFWEDSRYDPGKAFDGDPATAWVEGAPGPGIGETVVAAFVEYPEALGFINGFARNQNLFSRNHRVKILNVQLYLGVNVDGFATEVVTYYDALPVGTSSPLHLADSRMAQRLLLPISPMQATQAMNEFRNSKAVQELSFPQAVMMGISPGMEVPLRFRYILRLEIAEVFRGTSWEDTCIAEIWPDYGQIAYVDVDANMRLLLLGTPDGRQIPGYADFPSVLTILAQSEDAAWVIVIKEPAYPGSGRVSSEYAVIHSPTGRDMTSAVFADLAAAVTVTGPPGAGLLPYDFVEDAGELFVLYDNLETGESGRTRVPAVYPDP